jgi:integrase
MFNDAVGDGLVGENPFVGLRLAKKAAKRVVHFPTTAEVDLLYTTAADLGFVISTAIPFSAFTGIRLGESRAFSTLDLEPGGVGPRARIDYQLTPDNRLKAPKADGKRRILVPREARAALRARLLEVEQGSRPFGRPRRQGLVWALSERQWSRDWTRVRGCCNLEHLRWHDLRHHAATWFLDHGASVYDVAVQLGCAPLEVERTYGHPDPEKALARLERLTAP